MTDTHKLVPVLKFLCMSILLLCSLQVQAAEEFGPTLPTVYTQERVEFRQWNEMRDAECGQDIFVGVEDVEEWPEGLWPQIGALWEIESTLKGLFVYTSDGASPNTGITDIWCSQLDNINAGIPVEGDCDDFAFTAAAMLIQRGIPREHVFVAVVLTFRAESENPKHTNHPNKVHADHMIAMAWINETWVVFDNRFPVTTFSNAFYFSKWNTFRRYTPHSMVSMNNYGEGKANHTAAGFARFWVYD